MSVVFAAVQLAEMPQYVYSVFFFFFSNLTGKFGSDGHGATLRGVMAKHNVNVMLSETVENTPSGQAYILLQDGGQNSIVIVAAANDVSLLQHFSTENSFVNILVTNFILRRGQLS